MLGARARSKVPDDFKEPFYGPLDGMGAGAPPRMIVGCRSGVCPGGRATGVGGPSDRSAYECRTRCSRPFGRRMRTGFPDRGGAAGAIDAGPYGGDRLAAPAARTGHGDL